jgi:hypothetical protein
MRGDDGVLFNFDGWEKIVGTEIRKTLWEIHEANRDDKKGRYHPEWVEDNSFIAVTSGHLAFLE